MIISLVIIGKSMSYQLIANELNKKGFHTRKGNDWCATKVRRILVRGEPNLRI